MRTLGPGEQVYINTENEPGNNADIIGNSNVSGNSGYIYPIALRTTVNGIGYYQNEVKFEDFLRARSRFYTPDNSPDFFFTDRSGIADLLSSGTTDAVISDFTAPYTFICSDSSMKESPNGPYNLAKFYNLVDGVVNGTTLYTELQVSNPPSVTNLGDKIIDTGGAIEVSYDCESCIQPLGEDYKLTDTAQAEGCTYFVDTENGVLYEKETDETSPNYGRFRINGIPLRRQPTIPEPLIEKADIVGIITSSTNASANNPPTRWTYGVDEIEYSDGQSKFISSVQMITSTAYNGAENNDTLDGVGFGQFDSFPDPTAFTMLPIATGTVVNLHRIKGKYVFSIPNAYDGCGGA